MNFSSIFVELTCTWSYIWMTMIITINQNYIWWSNLDERLKSVIEIIKRIIKSMIILLYLIFVLSLIIGGSVLGVMTLLPDEASKPCYLGYYAHCSFTPYSTIILFSMAILGVILLLILIRYYKRK